jgi:hypothetical protein
MCCSSTTSMGWPTLNVLLSFAQFERDMTDERIRQDRRLRPYWGPFSLQQPRMPKSRPQDGAHPSSSASVPYRDIADFSRTPLPARGSLPTATTQHAPQTSGKVIVSRRYSVLAKRAYQLFRLMVGRTSERHYVASARSL